MIQRIQSIYLFIAVVLLTYTFFGAFFTFNDGMIVLDSFSCKTVAPGNLLTVEYFKTWPLAVINGLAAFISLVTIFLYKNRTLQIRLTIYTILILLGFYILLVYYRYFGMPKVVDAIIISSKMKIQAILPAIAAVFVYMANYAIRKDEAKVRAAERFR